LHVLSHIESTYLEQPGGFTPAMSPGSGRDQLGLVFDNAGPFWVLRNDSKILHGQFSGQAATARNLLP
jgi:hypothetical protein